MTILGIRRSKDFSGQTLSDVTRINFGNGALSATATFLTAQFDDVQIHADVTIHGSASINRLVLNGRLAVVDGFIASPRDWTFTNWGAEDSITFNVTEDIDTIIGTRQADTINALGGDDRINSSGGADIINCGKGEDRVTLSTVGFAVSGLTVNGGAGNDIFSFVFVSDYTGIAINGGGGNLDSIRTQNGIFDFTGVSISSVEALSIGITGGQDSTAIFRGDQIGVGSALKTIFAFDAADSAPHSKIIVKGDDIDLSNMKFERWDNSQDTIELHGDPVNNKLIGSSQNDTIIGDLGKDKLTGGGRDDIFVFATGDDSIKGVKRDVIADFVHNHDVIDLSGIDSGAPGGAFDFIGKSDFGQVAGQLRVSKDVEAEIKIIEGDIDGDGIADFEIELSGLVQLKTADFNL